MRTVVHLGPHARQSLSLCLFATRGGNNHQLGQTEHIVCKFCSFGEGGHFAKAKFCMASNGGHGLFICSKKESLKTGFWRIYHVNQWCTLISRCEVRNQADQKKRHQPPTWPKFDWKCECFMAAGVGTLKADPTATVFLHARSVDLECCNGIWQNSWQAEVHAGTVHVCVWLWLWEPPKILSRKCDSLPETHKTDDLPPTTQIF